MKTSPTPARPGSTGPARPAIDGEAEPCASDETLDGPRDAAAEPPDRDRIGRYLVLGRLGHGGMGVVLEAFDPELDRRVALKLLHPERSHGASRLRLLREAQALARLSHPNVVQVYDVGVDGDRVFMAMELVRGRTISAWLGERRRAWPEIVAPLVAAGRGLQAAHAAGLVHRDFKPHNVLVGDDGRVRVADFGLAGVEAAPEPSLEGPAPTSYLATPLTATGAVLGTPRYMAPEQHAGLEVGPAADQFAFCVTLHEALVGSHPFVGDTPLALVTNVLEGRIVPPSRRPDVPKRILAALRRGLAREPGARHASMDALLEVLEREPLRRRRWRVGMLGLALGVGTVGATWLGRAEAAPCTGGPAAIEAVWSGPQREAVEAALAAGPDGAVVLQTLDAYAEAWAESHRAVCLEHRDEAMSSVAFESAMGCLQRGRAALSGVVDTVATGEPATVAAAAVAAASLPIPAACRDRELLALDLGLPSDPAAAATAIALRERLARAEAVHDAGGLQPALAELSALEREATALGHAPLVAERALVAGRLAIDRREWLAARAELELATVRALAAEADPIAAEAAVRALFVDAMLDEPRTLEHADEAVAGALVERVGAPPGLAALLANNVGVRRGMSGRREDAARSFAQALARADAASDVDPVDHLGYVLNVALETADPAARDALFERARAQADRWLGPAHERSLDLAVLRAQHTVDPAVAIARMTPACARAHTGPHVPWHRCLCDYRLAELHEHTGADAAARAAIDEARRCLAAGDVAEGLAALQRDKTEAYAALLRGDHDEALAWVEQAERAAQPHEDLPWVGLELADVALLRARALHARGRGAEAIEPLRAAISTYDVELARTEDQGPALRRERATRLLAELEAQRRSSSPNSSSQR